MEPSITIRIKGDRESFAPGELLRGAIAWQSTDALNPAELSVLWHTEGKGDQDSGIVHFEEVALDDRLEHLFEVKLPLLPLTYHGELLKIHWTIRVRVDKRWSRDPLFELPFEIRATDSAPVTT